MWHGSDLEPVVSHIHWDILLMRPTVILGDRTICEKGVIPTDLTTLGITSSNSRSEGTELNSVPYCMGYASAGYF